MQAMEVAQARRVVHQDHTFITAAHSQDTTTSVEITPSNAARQVGRFLTAQHTVAAAEWGVIKGSE